MKIEISEKLLLIYENSLLSHGCNDFLRIYFAKLP